MAVTGRLADSKVVFQCLQTPPTGQSSSLVYLEKHGSCSASPLVKN